jgi:hypothetical protein
MNVVQVGHVRFNEKGYVVNIVTGEEILIMFGKGGMKILLPPMMVPHATTVNHIMLEEDKPAAEIGNEGTVCVATI